MFTQTFDLLLMEESRPQLDQASAQCLHPFLPIGHNPCMRHHAKWTGVKMPYTLLLMTYRWGNQPEIKFRLATANRYQFCEQSAHTYQAIAPDIFHMHTLCMPYVCF